MNIRPKDIGTYEVQSRTNPEHFYTVDVNEMQCTCPGFMEFGATALCFHLRACLRIHSPATLSRPVSGSPFALLKCKTTKL